MKKAACLLIFVAFSAALSAAQNVRQDGVVQSRSGAPAPGASIAVCSQPVTSIGPPCQPLALLCASLTDTTCSQPNPVKADGLGNYHFYVPSTALPVSIQYYGSTVTTYLIPDQTFGGGGGGGSALTQTYTNSSNGTTCNGLAKIDSTVGASTLGNATSTTGGELLILGVVVNGCGTSGSVTIQFVGSVPVIFDSATPTVGDAVGVSGSVTGAATDLGSSNPTSTGAIIGTVLKFPNGSGPTSCTVAPGCYIQITSLSVSASSSANALVNNPATTAANTITPTASTVIPISPGCNSGAGSSQQCLNVTNGSAASILTVQNNGQAQIGSASGTKAILSGTSSNTDLDGNLTMSSGTATYTWLGTYNVHPTCTANDETAIAAVKITYTSTTSVTFTTSGSTDVIDYHCIGRN